MSCISVTIYKIHDTITLKHPVFNLCITFQSLFVDNPSPHPIVILKDVTYADLRTMVDFMYCGEVNVTEEQLPKVSWPTEQVAINNLSRNNYDKCMRKTLTIHVTAVCGRFMATFKLRERFLV